MFRSIEFLEIHRRSFCRIGVEGVKDVGQRWRYRYDHLFCEI